MTKTSFIEKGIRDNDLLVLLHTNVYKPLNTSDIGGFQHFITLIDKYNWYGYAHLMKHKLEYFKSLKELKNEVQN